ncbi:EF-Hand 1, calcium-binding site [Sesbania bispinosa]|nr:EF-Hand 1, calcium-binding site [Sesbania bispinosa]
MYQGFIKPWIEHTRKELEFKRHTISEVLRHVGSLCNDDGTPDESAIRRLFEQLDSNGDNRISKSELKKLVTDIHIGDAEKAVTKLIQDLDINRDNEVSEEEFVDVFTSWINKILAKLLNQYLCLMETIKYLD